LAPRVQAASEEYAQECWAIDSKLSEEVKWERDGVSVPVFPFTRLRYVGDYSSDLLRTLKAESRRQDATMLSRTFFLQHARMTAPNKEGPDGRSTPW
jgi:hypothetical protein